GGEALMLKRVIVATALLSLASPGLHAQGRGGQPSGPQKITAIRAGRLIDPEAGTAATNQIIVTEGERIRDVGPNVPIPSGAEVIDLSRMTVLPGFVDTHTHEAMTYKEVPENSSTRRRRCTRATTSCIRSTSRPTAATRSSRRSARICCSGRR